MNNLHELNTELMRTRKLLMDDKTRELIDTPWLVDDYLDVLRELQLIVAHKLFIGGSG